MEQETFWTLLHNAPHWEFELFLMFIFDILIGAVIWPYLLAFIRHHRGDDSKIEVLEKKVASLERIVEAMEERTPLTPTLRILENIADLVDDE